MALPGNDFPHRQTVINGLAVAGFVSLMIGGMWLAVYSTRFVPVVADRLGAAAVYFSSVFTPAPAPIATSTPPATPASQAATSTTHTVVSHPEAVTPTAGKETNSTIKIGGTVASPTLHGLPDLAVHITAVGYLATTSAASFTASSTVPAHSRPAIKFTIKNVGTNVSGPWIFNVVIPTESAYLYTSPRQQSLAPGDSIAYTLGFDQPTAGSNKKITVTVNPNHTVAEATTSNNIASTTITVLGS